MIACVFDFLDGFVARALKQGSPMGKELDSLADMVTFGVVPGMVMFEMLRFTATPAEVWGQDQWKFCLPYLGFLIPLFSGLRLAKFNVDTNQSDSFIGLPTLANALLVCGLPLMFNLQNTEYFSYNGFTYLVNDYVPNTMVTVRAISYSLMEFWHSQWTLIGVTVVLSILLISPIPMFSFKVKSMKWKGNEIRYIFLILAAGLFALLKLGAFPMIILFYIVLSMVFALTKKSSPQA